MYSIEEIHKIRDQYEKLSNELFKLKQILINHCKHENKIFVDYSHRGLTEEYYCPDCGLNLEDTVIGLIVE